MTFNKADPDPLTETPDSLTTYVIGDDVIAQTTGGTTQYLLYDGHGSTRQLAEYDTEVTIADSYSYDGYGVLLQDGSVAQNNPGKVAQQATSLLYAGEQFDTNAQQYYLRARYYDPLNGRFNRIDPFSGNPQDPQSLHKYLYCHNNPVNNIDPTGRFTLSQLVVIAVIVAIIGVAIWGTHQVYRRLRPVLLAARSTLMAVERLQQAIAQMKRWPRGHRMRKCANWLVPVDIGEYGYAVNNQVKVFPGGENDVYGLHARVSPYVFVCQWVVDTQNDLGLAVIIFGEWQHHTEGGRLNETQAQAELNEIQQDIRQADPTMPHGNIRRTNEMTPFIERLNHGVR